MGKHLLPVGDDIGEEQKEKGPKESEFSELFSQATEAAKILDNNKLDGRAIDTNGTLRKHSIGNMIKSLPGILLGIFLLPFLFLSSGLILILCTYLGNITDEGEDARTSIHFVGFILTPFVYWSFMSAISVFLLASLFEIRPAIMGWEQITLIQSVPFYIIIWSLMYPLFWLINKISLTFCLDSLNDFMWEIRINKLNKHQTFTKLDRLLGTLNSKVKELM